MYEMHSTLFITFLTKLITSVTCCPLEQLQKNGKSACGCWDDFRYFKEESEENKDIIVGFFKSVT